MIILAVVTILSNGKTKEETLATIARNIWLQCAEYDIQLTVTHIAGVKNTMADLLARWTNSENYVKNLNKLLPNHSWIDLPEVCLYIFRYNNSFGSSS